MGSSLLGSSVHGDSPGKNTGVGCHVLLQGIFPTQGSNPGLPHCRWILHCLSHQGSLRIWEWVAYRFSRGTSQLRNQTRISYNAGGFSTSWATTEAQSEVIQLCLTLCDPMDCSLPGSSVHGIFQARILEWGAISFSGGSSLPRDWTRVSHIVGRCFTVWATREAQTTRKSNIIYASPDQPICLLSCDFAWKMCFLKCLVRQPTEGCMDFPQMFCWCPGGRLSTWTTWLNAI